MCMMVVAYVRVQISVAMSICYVAVVSLRIYTHPPHLRRDMDQGGKRFFVVVVGKTKITFDATDVGQALPSPPPPLWSLF